ncbi:MAG: sugar ABC transporter permease [Anaerolineaceae bacterium]|nr:sugar ABC transporter permease [Anaerolineaceae bacterium]
MQDQVVQATAPAVKKHRKSGIVPYLFILPHSIFFLAFLAYPFFYGLYISLFQFDYLRPEHRPFVGFNNYLQVFTPTTVQYRDFWRSMSNTGQFLLWSVIPLVIVALLLAVLLNGKYRGRNMFRMIYFAPYALSVTVASILWLWIFQREGGLLNHYLEIVGLPTINWLGRMPEAWISITIATIWWTIGFNTVIFLAALQEIPTSLYEAAAIDGASPVQQFFNITIPMMRSVLIFVITITMIASANLFGQPYIMTAGGPVQRTETIIYRIFIEGIGRGQMGRAAAMSILLAIMLLFLTAVNFKVFGQTERS